MARAGVVSLGEAAERSHEVSDEASDEVSDEVSDGVSDGVSDDYRAIGDDGFLPSEASGSTEEAEAAEAAALEESVDNVIDGPYEYSPAPFRPVSPRAKPAAAAAAAAAKDSEPAKR